MTNTYIFTEFYPSGNSQLWYYDKNQSCMFIGSDAVAKWSRKPEIGDTVKLVHSGNYNEFLERAFVNDELVFEFKQQ